MVLLYANRYLFTGDHLAWDRDDECLIAFHDYCWHSWPQQVRSLVRLLDYDFEWVLPGHGQRVHLPAQVMHRELQTLIARISGKVQPAEKH
jgi:glyoxylase-like metal-dependent hydrolase (beta-lactamase superfamily II)